MNHRHRLIQFGLALLTTLTLQLNAAHAAVFSYHGTLQDNGNAADGNYDLQLTLYSAATGGRVIGGPLTIFQVPVNHGSFSTEAEFANVPTTASTAWLGVGVRSASASGEFVTLSARSAVSMDSTVSVCPGAWTLDGNAGNLAGSILGTTDTQPLLFAVNGLTNGRITASGNGGIPDAANVVFGSPSNSSGSGNYGATISGGGKAAMTCGANANATCTNQATGDFAAIGGGFGNAATAEAATVAGGNSNKASNGGAFVGAGFNNIASGQLAGIGAGQSNKATTLNSFIGGGVNNATNGNLATIGGGESNNASGYESAISGGNSNLASGTQSAVVGGISNQATGSLAWVGGGLSNVAGGDASFAGGALAKVRNAAQAASLGTCSNSNTCGDFATFVWSDGQGTAFTSTTPNQFLIRSAGGVGINTNQPAPNSLSVQGPDGAVTGFTPQPNSALVVQNGNNAFVELSAPNESGLFFNLGTNLPSGGVVYNPASFPSGLELRTGGNVTQFAIDSSGNTYNRTGSWSVFSDIRLKRDIAPIEHPLDTFLGLHGQTFAYLDAEREIATPGRRMGFIAQDVERVVPQWVSEDPRGYKMVTATGFEALTVEAVRALRDEKDLEIADLQARLDDVIGRLGKLEHERSQ